MLTDRSACAAYLPVTANRYYVQDEFGEILCEVDDLNVALRVKARFEVEDGRRVRFVDRVHDEEGYKR